VKTITPNEDANIPFLGGVAKIQRIFDGVVFPGIFPHNS